MSQSQTILVWFRNDLRIHDHGPLYQAIQSGCGVIPLYCLDPRHFGVTPYGFPKTGAFRAQFLLESLADLRQSLRGLGSDLLLRQGCPEDVIPALAQSLGVTRVIFNREVTSEELLASNLNLTSNKFDLYQATFHIVAVPTPITSANQPDLAPLL
ncbi:MAG: cryptochrome DASH, partial [Acaryochloridaceae cyanobacterium RL_2_7]|nr:cryptochrome DASH [Acaryochloridaceae cyanobacterium RL_2_7]